MHLSHCHLGPGFDSVGPVWQACHGAHCPQVRRPEGTHRSPTSAGAGSLPGISPPPAEGSTLWALGAPVGARVGAQHYLTSRVDCSREKTCWDMGRYQTLRGQHGKWQDSRWAQIGVYTPMTPRILASTACSNTFSSRCGHRHHGAMATNVDGTPAQRLLGLSTSILSTPSASPPLPHTLGSGSCGGNNHTPVRHDIGDLPHEVGAQFEGGGADSIRTGRRAPLRPALHRRAAALLQLTKGPR